MCTAVGRFFSHIVTTLVLLIFVSLSVSLNRTDQTLISFIHPTHRFTKYSACFQWTNQIDLRFLLFFPFYFFISLVCFTRISFTWFVSILIVLSHAFNLSIPLYFTDFVLIYEYIPKRSLFISLFLSLSHRKLFTDNWLITTATFWEWTKKNAWNSYSQLIRLFLDRLQQTFIVGWLYEGNKNFNFELLRSAEQWNCGLNSQESCGFISRWNVNKHTASLIVICLVQMLSPFIWPLTAKGWAKRRNVPFASIVFDRLTKWQNILMNETQRQRQRQDAEWECDITESGERSGL